ncbi:hypothetical protein GCM10010232_49940 [Streptomyces amakusaensis]|uniref:Uncharacterized protein n=1 Tax=Streptomyces amakusaensis TaxID=67271 RepID=A0ABW0AMY6_9ACTN
MTGAPYGLSLDPHVVADLLSVPDAVRDRALARLGELTTVVLAGGTSLPGELAGFRELPLGEDAEWGLVYTRRPAPPASAHRTEIHVVAVRSSRPCLHDTVRARLGLTRPLGAMAHASRTRSPQLPAQHDLTPSPRPVFPARPGLAHPAPAPTLKGLSL